MEAIKPVRACNSFFFHAEDGIRAGLVTGVQTCALPIYGVIPDDLARAGVECHDVRVRGAEVDLVAVDRNRDRKSAV